MTTTVLEPSIKQNPDRPLSQRPSILYVELDHTLLATNTFLESILLLVKRNPLFLFCILIWACRGLDHCQKQIAKRIHLDVTNLPYRQHVMTRLREEYEQGRVLALLSGWNLEIAQAVSKHLNMFSLIALRSDLRHFSSPQYQTALDTQAGQGGFIYMTHSQAEHQIWKVAQEVILVKPSGVGFHHQNANKSVEVLEQGKAPSLSVLSKALRVHQWVKNILLFIPIATAHQFFHIDQLFQAFVAFFAFSFCASGLYIFNDLLDLPADRRHPKKKYRPFASGTLSIKTGLWLQPILLGISFSISLLALPVLFSFLLVGYAITTVLYSTYFKKVAILDVLILAGFYTLRIFAGGVAVSVAISSWLLAFSVFFFLSLAFGKRYAELQIRKVEKYQGIERRAYVGADKEIIGTMGTMSGYMSVLVLALYLNSTEVLSTYQNPDFLWLICPLLLYWISRTWLLAHRGNLDDDPLIVALKDPNSYVVGAGAAILAALAI